MAQDSRCALPVQAQEPYPPVQAEGRSIPYARAILSNVGGSTSEITAVNRYFYAQLVTDVPEVAETLRSISFVEMHHLNIFGRLALQLGVSRPTVRQALDSLAREGRVNRVKGSGTFVCEPKLVHESTTFVTGYREESRKRHRTLRTKVVCLRMEKAEGTVAEALRLKPGQSVTKLTRIRHLEDVNSNAPVVYTTVYVPCKLFPDMAELDFTDASLYEALDSRDLSVVHASRRLEVVMPPAEVAAGLGIGPFEPTVFICSKGSTKTGQMVEYSESYYPASRSSFQIEIQR